MFKNKKNNVNYLTDISREGCFNNVPISYDIFGMLSQMEEHNKQREREEKGIAKKDGYEGVERLNIPYIYDSIEIKDGYFYCYKYEEKRTTVYNKDGKELFSGLGVYYYKDGMFLVKDKSKNSTKHDDYCALFNEDVKLTDYIFRGNGLYSSFNEHGFLILGEKDSYKNCVINKKGEINC